MAIPPLLPALPDIPVFTELTATSLYVCVCGCIHNFVGVLQCT